MFLQSERVDFIKLMLEASDATNRVSGENRKPMNHKNGGGAHVAVDKEMTLEVRTN